MQQEYFCGKEHQAEYKRYHGEAALPSVFPKWELVVEDETPPDAATSDDEGDGASSINGCQNEANQETAIRKHYETPQTKKENRTLQLVDHLYILRRFSFMPSFFDSFPEFVTASVSGNFTFWFPQSVAYNSSQSSIERQIATPQDLPRRNISRSLCGAIVKTSPKATRFPRILLSSSSSSLRASQKCASNAILYMVQKGKHSSYNRNSTALFFKSLDKLYDNYLSLDQHSENADVLIVHSGDYTQGDLDYLDRRYNHTVHFKLIDVSDTDYWTIPESVQHDNISNWNVFPEFSVGYRHMIRWYALKLYDFVRDYAERKDGCRYTYLMRMDEDSFVHSPIRYDLFEFMQDHNYSYGFRMCAYEMETDVWEDYEDHIGHCYLSLPDGRPFRRIEEGLCAFYNNFFVMDVRFIFQPEVQHFLQWNDAVGVMYRERYNDLQIQAIAVYHFMPPEQIHRFLDFTYEHMSSKQIEELQCPYWGAIQAGYLDTNTNANTTFRRFAKESGMNRHRCPGIRRNFAFATNDLSPTYSHLPPPLWWNMTLGVHRAEFRWKTFAAGSVEARFKGIMSG